jgi:arylsulfatase A-like enzyme
MNAASRSANDRPPNILWLCTDQQRYDTISALGNPLIRTPHLDSLVASGVSFTHAYCQSTVCSPSRASFLTGRYPRTTGCRQNGQQLPASERLISRLFADAGYTCGLAGKQHLASCADGRVEARGDDGYHEFHWSHHPQPDWPENQYSQWLAQEGQSWESLYDGPKTAYTKHGIPAAYHQTTWCANKTIDFLQQHQDVPWFFSFNCFDPHHPFDPPADYFQRYQPEQMPLPRFQPGELANKPRYQQLDHEWAHNEPGFFHVSKMTSADQQEVTAAYYGMVELIDDQVGRILTALEETGQRERTIILFMSDHGEMLGDHGLYLKGPHFYESSVHVPLVFSWPDRFQQNLRADGLIELVDLAPTLLAAAGEPVPASMQGQSLLPILSGEHDPTEHRDYVYCEYYNAWTHHRSYGTMMRTRDQKIVVYHGVEDGELYDLARDPDEFNNLYDQPDHAELRHQLLKRAFDASVFTMDPLPERLGPF